MSAIYNDLLLVIFVLITVPCFAYWMGYRSGERSGTLKIGKGGRDKQ